MCVCVCVCVCVRVRVCASACSKLLQFKLSTGPNNNFRVECVFSAVASLLQVEAEKRTTEVNFRIK